MSPASIVVEGKGVPRRSFLVAAQQPPRIPDEERAEHRVEQLKSGLSKRTLKRKRQATKIYDRRRGIRARQALYAQSREPIEHPFGVPAMEKYRDPSAGLNEEIYSSKYPINYGDWVCRQLPNDTVTCDLKDDLLGTDDCPALTAKYPGGDNDWRDEGLEALGKLQQAANDDPYFIAASAALHSSEVPYVNAQAFVNHTMKLGSDYFADDTKIKLDIPDAKLEGEMVPEGYARGLEMLATKLTGASAARGGGPAAYSSQHHEAADTLHTVSKIYSNICAADPAKCATDDPTTSQFVIELMLTTGIGPKMRNLTMEYLGDKTAVALDRHTVNFFCNQKPGNPECYQYNLHARDVRNAMITKQRWKLKNVPGKKRHRRGASLQGSEWSGMWQRLTPQQMTELEKIMRDEKRLLKELGIKVPREQRTDISKKPFQGGVRLPEEGMCKELPNGDLDCSSYEGLREKFGFQLAKPCGMAPAHYQVSAWLKGVCERNTRGPRGGFLRKFKTPWTHKVSMACVKDGISFEDLT